MAVQGVQLVNVMWRGAWCVATQHGTVQLGTVCSGVWCAAGQCGAAQCGVCGQSTWHGVVCGVQPVDMTWCGA